MENFSRFSHTGVILIAESLSILCVLKTKISRFCVDCQLVCLNFVGFLGQREIAYLDQFLFYAIAPKSRSN